MKIFVAGATGTLGRPVVRELISKGHQVSALSRSRDNVAGLEAQGVRAFLGDALDGARVRTILKDVRPEIVLHLLTAIPPGGPVRPFQMRATNDLRIHGTRNLVRAAIASGTRRMVGESFVAVHGSTHEWHALDEDDALEAVEPGPFAETVMALRSLEDQLREAHEAGTLESVALRFGLLYGAHVPATQMLVRQARAGRLFVPEPMGGTGAFVHLDDAVRAIVAAVEHVEPFPVYHIVDDQPLAFNAFLRTLASTLGAPAPRAIPAWLVRLAAPMLTEMGNARFVLSNARARRHLKWALRHPNVETGLAELAASAQEAA